MTSLPLDSNLATRHQAVACAHCGLDVPATMRDDAEVDQFCCAGCRTVFRAIKDCGLDQYYALRKLVDSGAEPAHVTGRRFTEFDDAQFQERYCQQLADGRWVTHLALEGVHCGACLWLIEKLPTLLDGVAEARLNLARKVVRIVWDVDTTPLSSIARRLASFGYVPHAITSSTSTEIRRAEDRRFLIRIAVAGALAGNVMLIAFCLYGGMFHGIETQYYQLFRWTSLALTLVALLWPGRVFVTGAISALRARTPHMDIPVATGLLVGTIWSVVTTFIGSGEVYFDSITLLIFLLLVGRWIQIRQQRQSTDAVELLFSMTPRFARLVDGDEVRDVAMESLTPGQHVEIRPGETVPVDGVVVEGRSSLNMSWLTGESRPISVGPGGTVCAGSTNVGARLVVSTVATGESTRAGRLMQLVEETATRRAPVARLADRIAGVFIVVILSLAALTIALWMLIEPSRAIENAIALLIITCPCALGLATPLAIVAALGRAARRGILIKGGDAVEAMTRRHGLVYLDKTGTLTEGNIALREWHGDEAVRSLLISLERTSAHPVAQAIAAAYPDAVLHEAHQVATHSNGIAGVVAGRTVVAGARGCLQAHSVAIAPWAAALETSITHRALSPVFVAVDGVLRAVVAVGDSVRADAPDAVAAVRRLGWDVAVLSGDHPEVVRAIAEQVGIDPGRCHGAATPEDKLRIVERDVVDRPVVMVGDGVNDAAALTAATVGVAVHGGAEASLASADVYLNRNDLTALPELLAGSARTLAVIRRGLGVSLFYNVIGSSLAIAGLINPLVAAVLMPISSLTVITLAFRARTFGSAPCR